MKALRYLLMVMIVALASVTAQAQLTTPFKNSENKPAFNTQKATTGYAFYTTSTLMESGSSLPVAARNGLTIGADSPDDETSSPLPRRPRRVSDDDSPGSEPGQESPIGDGMWVLLLLAAGFAFGKWRYQMMLRRRKATA